MRRRAVDQQWEVPMTVKIDGIEPNVFPAVEGVDARDVGRNAEVILGTKIEGQLTPGHNQAELRTGRSLGGSSWTLPKELDRDWIKPPLGEAAHARRGAADRGEYRQAAEALAPERKLNGAAAKKIEPQFFAVCL
jgi:hypothetical protein